jgi:hypothetical protein
MGLPWAVAVVAAAVALAASAGKPQPPTRRSKPLPDSPL